jgi:hypothetical protein
MDRKRQRAPSLPHRLYAIGSDETASGRAGAYPHHLSFPSLRPRTAGGPSALALAALGRKTARSASPGEGCLRMIPATTHRRPQRPEHSGKPK